MAKNTMPEVKNEQKVQTKYDRKMAARKQQEEQAKKEEKRFKVISRAVIAVVLVAIIAAVGTTIYMKNQRVNGTYVLIGDREVTGLEYDYYYNASVNSFLASYASFLPYLGLDTSVDYADQPYDENGELSWKDEFDRMAVVQMRQIFALSKEANEKGFTYDTETEYQEHQKNLKEAAKAAEVSLAEYYKTSFGENATVSNMEAIIKEGIYANAYKEHLKGQNLPTEDEITTYYNENKDSYNNVDYRSFVFTAAATEESTEEEIAASMDELKKSADEFLAKRQEGADFEELCIEYASDTAKGNYENEETEYSLSTGKNISGVPSDASEWLFDDSRAEGDITVIKSNDYNQYYVVEFIQKYKGETADDTISEALSAAKVTEYLNGLIENFQINDIHNNFKYLTVTTEETTEDVTAMDEVTEEVTDEAAEETAEDTTEVTEE